MSFAGDVDFGPHATLDDALAQDYTALRLAWFDRHLRGIAGTPEPLTAPVSLFVMGGGSGGKTGDGRLDHGGRWVEETAWPPPASKPTAYYLSADGGLSLAPTATRPDPFRRSAAQSRPAPP